MRRRLNPKVRAVFYEVRDVFGEEVDDVILRRCNTADQTHKESARQFAHVGCQAGKVCVASAVNQLPIPHLLGLFAHEFGHIVDRRRGGKGTNELDADEIAELFGYEMEYRDYVLRNGYVSRFLQWSSA